MRILVCGGRSFNDFCAMDRVLTDLYVDRNDDLVIIHGGASGADALAADWAVNAWRAGSRVWVVEFRADWDKHGKAAGPIRNRRMLVEGRPDTVVAFPGGAGTADMVCQARKAGVEVREVS